MRKFIPIIIAFLFFPNVLAEHSISDITDSKQQIPGREYVYHKYLDMTLELQDLADNYPNVMKMTSIGQSILGRQLWNVQITNFEDTLNLENRSKIYIDGGHHGNEYCSSETAFLLIKYLVENYNNDNYITSILNSANIFITPLINPDGIDHDTRFNSRGVDLNRNYPYAWTQANTHGSGPASEPEVANNIKFMEKHDFDLYLTLHTGIIYLIYPWGYSYEIPPDMALFLKVEKDIEEKYGIRAGQSSTSLYNASGTSEDYGYGERLIPTWTFEVDNQQYSPGSTTPVQERLQLVFDICLYMVDETINGLYRANLTVSNIDIPSVKKNEKFEIQYTIYNSGYANVTNATAFLLSDGVKFLDNQTKLISIGQLNSTNISFKLEALDKDIMNLELIINYQKIEIENSTIFQMNDNRNFEIDDSKVIGKSLGFVIGILIIIGVCFFIYKKRNIEMN